MIPTYYEGIPVVTIYYVVTRAVMLAVCAGEAASRVWRGKWHSRPSKDRLDLLMVVLVSLAPVLGELVAAFMFGELLDALSKRRALSIRAEEGRQRPEVGQLTVKDDAP